jgi:hypothetical protein
MMMVIMYNEARDSEAKTGEPFVTEQYLEDFERDKPSDPGASASMRTASRALPLNSIRNRFISTKAPRPTRYSAVWPQAAGTPPLSRCDCWSPAI